MRQLKDKLIQKHFLLEAKNAQLDRVYYGMVDRCTNVNHRRYDLYGGRGISVCKEWLEDKVSFLKWGIANGYKRGLQIDRIDNDGNYEPGNCRFVTSKQNNLNKSTCIYVTHNGIKKPLRTWCKELGINFFNVYHPIHKQNLTPEQSFTNVLNDPKRIFQAKIQSQVCKLSQAKRLMELGIAQESLFIWVIDNRKDWAKVKLSITENNGKVYSAFNSEELGLMLNSYKAYVIEDIDNSEAIDRAEHLIFLLESMELSAEEVNQRLTKTEMPMVK